jgi:type VI secretion system secreted protein Hcp
MKKQLAVAAVVVGSVLCLAVQSQAAAYIKFDGVDGEAVEQGHTAWSDLVSLSQGLHQPGGGATGQSRRRGDVVLEDVTCVKELDKASPKLAEAVCGGRVFPKVTIHLTRAHQGKQTTYFIVTMTTVQISSYAVGGLVVGEELPVEEFSLNFEEIKVTYVVLDESDDGTVPPEEVSYECAK